MLTLNGLEDLKESTQEGRVVREGYLPLAGALSGFRTYVRVVGDIQADKTPLVLLHGGPGSTHNSLELLDPIAELLPVVMYDQIGCGNSFVAGRDELWRMSTWEMELEQLLYALGIERAHVLGQSFGGMLALQYAFDYKEQIATLILSSTLSSSKLWADEGHRLARSLDFDVWRELSAAELAGDFTGDAYAKALDVYMNSFCYDTNNPDLPECVLRPKPKGGTCYEVAWGPNELCATGTLKDFDVTERLFELDMPALVTNGEFDLSTDLISDTMAEGLPNAKRYTYKGARHVCYVQKTDEYLEQLRRWLGEYSRS